MNEERLLILKMLEQGKISAEEAAALLEALEERESKDMRDADGGEDAGDWATETPDSDTAHDKGRENKAKSSKTASTAAGDGDDDRETRIGELGCKAEEWGREVAESVTRFAGRLQETIEQKLVPGLENFDEWVSAYKLRYLRQWHSGLSIDRQNWRRRTAPLCSGRGSWWHGR